MAARPATARPSRTRAPCPPRAPLPRTRRRAARSQAGAPSGSSPRGAARLSSLPRGAVCRRGECRSSRRPPTRPPARRRGSSSPRLLGSAEAVSVDRAASLCGRHPEDAGAGALDGRVGRDLVTSAAEESAPTPLRGGRSPPARRVVDDQCAAAGHARCRRAEHAEAELAGVERRRAAWAAHRAAAKTAIAEGTKASRPNRRPDQRAFAASVPRRSGCWRSKSARRFCSLSCALNKSAWRRCASALSMAAQ